jgi:nucleoside triphosphatase
MPKQSFPEPTVGAFVFNPEGLLLLVRSHKWRGKWVVPGGHLELGERLENAVLREVREETGLEVTDIRFINFQECIYDEAFWKRRHFVFFDYTCRSRRNTVQLNSEAEAYKWVSLEEAAEMDLDAYTRVSLQVIRGATEEPGD